MQFQKSYDFLIANLRWCMIQPATMDWLTAELFWFLLGFVLLLAEFALPGVIIVFFGLGAWMAALTTWLGLTKTMASQNLVFVIASIVLLFGLRKRFHQSLVGDTTDDTIEDEYTGKEVIALTSIDDRSGKIEVKGAEWSARAVEPIEAGMWVVIMRREGLTFHVKPR
jgi:membrane protein implicated in regulation of membrane protease activity